MTELDPMLGTIAEDLVAMAHRFLVLIDNPAYNLGFWQKASGLTVRWEMCNYRVGDQGNEFWIYPGTTKYENIKLMRAVSPASTVVQSWLAATSAHAQPLTGAIQLLDNLGIPVMQWRLYQFFPVAWQVGEFNAAEAKVVMETLELAHTGFLDDQTTGHSPVAANSAVKRLRPKAG
jgi:phage tail-like protein